jgi:hypothetical protein
MPEAPKTMFGLPCSLESLRKPVQSIPPIPDPAEQKKQKEKALEEQIKRVEILANVWKVNDFRDYCEKHMREAQDALLRDTEHAKMLAAQSLARAWATIIRDFTAMDQMRSRLEVKLAEIRTVS